MVAMLQAALTMRSTMSACAIPLASLALVAACGSEAGVPSSSSQLTVTSAVDASGSAVVPDPTGASFRIDFAPGELDAETVTAVIAPRFGDPVSYVGVRVENQIELEPADPSRLAFAGPEFGGVGLTRLSIGVRDGDAGTVLDGPGTYEGISGQLVDGVGWVQTIQGELSGRRDDLAPELRFVGGGPQTRPLLPWSELQVEVSEPIDPSELERLVEGPADSVVVPIEEPSGLARTARVRPADGWWSRSSDNDVRVSVVPGTLDPSGNIDLLGFDGRRNLIRETTHLQRLDFDASESDFERWGPTTDASDVACASGSGCEAFDLTSAVFYSSGLFAHMERAEPFSEIGARFRFIAPPNESLTVRIRAAAPGGRPVHATVEAQTDESGDTGWLELSLPLESPLTEAAVVVDFSPRSFVCDSCLGLLDDVDLR